MAVVLPDPGQLRAVERTLDGPTLGRLLTGLRPGTVDLALPSWKVRTQAPLRETLSRMGMPTAFDPDTADLSA
jgi:serpin B